MAAVKLVRAAWVTVALGACSKPFAAPSPLGSATNNAHAGPAVAADAAPTEADATAARAEVPVDRGGVSPLEGDEAEVVLFADAPDAKAARAVRCPRDLPAERRVNCLIELRFTKDAAAAKVALELYGRYGILAGVDVDHVMNGGYRGMLHLVPAPPIGVSARHIAWVLAAAKDFDGFFAALAARGARDVRYRWHPFALRYMRSVGARTPSAYAQGWEVAYNLDGSLHVSGDAVRETMFHEIFHLNDAAQDDWSVAALGPIFDSIVRKCGTALPCLTPFTPNATVVRGGTYYSFQPGNGVREYAAELAIRYYREQRALVSGRLGMAPFKCGPPSNARAWELIVNAFFGGFDLVPPCDATRAK